MSLEQDKKKRKHESSQNAAESPKKSKKNKNKDKESIERHKEKKRKKERAREAVEEVKSDFVQLTLTMTLSLSPKYTMKPFEGASAALDAMVMRYVPALEGVLLVYSNVQFTSQTARLQEHSPFIQAPIQFDACIWSPRIGMKLKGRHIISSPSHLGLLVHQTFNVTIPSPHIPQALEQDNASETDDISHITYEFVHGVEIGDEVEQNEASDTTPEQRGHWRSTTSHEPIQGLRNTNDIEFTVTGWTIAGHMLSLVGSLQSDPFNPRHDAKVQTNKLPNGDTSLITEEADLMDIELELQYPPESQSQAVESDIEDEASLKVEVPIKKKKEKKSKEEKKKRKAENEGGDGDEKSRKKHKVSSGKEGEKVKVKKEKKKLKPD